MYGASVGTDVKLVSLNAEQSIGLSLNAALSVSNRDYSGIGFEIPLLVWLPEYVTWRWGARSSRKSQQDFGVGIGAGYRFGFVLQQGFHAPCAMVEGIYVLGNHDVLLRLSTDLGARRFDRPYGNEAIAAHELHFASLSLGFTY